MIDKETKRRLFEQMQKYEELASVETYDGRDYFEISNGAFQMLDILGLAREYIRWDDEKEVIE